MAFDLGLHYQACMSQYLGYTLLVREGKLIKEQFRLSIYIFLNNPTNDKGLHEQVNNDILHFLGKKQNSCKTQNYRKKAREEQKGQVQQI